MSAEILIIDDNSDIRLILDELIKEAGYQTRLAANFSQALIEIDKKLNSTDSVCILSFYSFYSFIIFFYNINT